MISLVLTSQLPLLPSVVSGGLLIGGDSSALYWVVAGTVLSFAAGVLNAWVLLIEIPR